MIYEKSNVSKNIAAGLFFLGIVSLNAGTALADKCGKGDRVRVPSCVNVEYSDGPGNYDTTVHMWNGCNQAVTLKIDWAKCGDDRITLNKGNIRERTRACKLNNVRCCPRYNSC